MNDVEIMHVSQPASNSTDLGLEWKINKVATECRTVNVCTTNQTHLVSLRVLFEVFYEPEMAGSVEDERERVARRGGNPNKRNNVRMGELTTCQNLSAVSLEQNVNYPSQ